MSTPSINLGRRRSNHAGSQNSTLNMVKNSVEQLKFSGKVDADAINFLLAAIENNQRNLGSYVLGIETKNNDTIVEKINQSLAILFASLYDQVEEKLSSLSNDASALSDLIQKVVVGVEDILITNQYVKDNIDEIRAQLQNISSTANEKNEPSGKADLTYENKNVEDLKDVKSTDYKDSTNAKNFSTLEDKLSQKFDATNSNIAAIEKRINKQFEQINDKLSSMANISLFGTIISFLGTGAGGIMGLLTKATSGIFKLSKTIVSPVLKLGKLVSSGIFVGISKSIGLVLGSIAAIGAGISFLKNGIVNGFKKIGSGIANFGKKVGNVIASPFRAIGKIFTRNKDDIRARKKEMLREKIQERMNKVIDKIVDMLEPFISMVGIFVKMAIVPILTTFAYIVTLVAAFALLGVGLYLAYKWVKEKIWPYISAAIDWIKEWAGKIWGWLTTFWDWIVAAYDWTKNFIGQIWDGIKAFFTKDFWIDVGKQIWEGIKGFGQSIADGYNKVNDWISEKFAQFGNWIYDKVIAPAKKWINQKIVGPIKNFYKDHIEPTIGPFVDSVKEFINRIRNAFSVWDTTKSVWENLKNIGSIVKDSVKEWWETSPFKPIVDAFIEDIKGFISVIKNAFSAWDPNISVWDNMKNIGSIIVGSVKEWWETSTLKEWVDKIVNKIGAIKDVIVNAVTEWYKTSFLKKAVDRTKLLTDKYVVQPFNKAREKISSFREKLADKFVIKIPSIEWRGWKGGIGVTWKEFKPFNFAAQPPDVQDSIPSEEEIDESELRAAEAESLAAQQIGPSMQSVNAITNNIDNTELEEATAEMSNKMDTMNEATKKFQEQQAALGSQYMQQFDLLNQKLDNQNNKQPNYVPMPIAYPTGPYNSANMNSF